MSSNRYLDVIIDNIKNDRCAIMIGPNLAETQDGETIPVALEKYLREETSLNFDYDLDSLIIFKDKTSKTFFNTDLKKFYQRHREPNEIHRMLARIPCHLIITVNPDHMLPKAYEDFGISLDFQYYNKKQNPKDIERPTAKRPLVYNLFGSISDEDSLIVTHDDLFEFLFAILGGDKRLPLELKSTLQTCRVFIFLGFDFKKWYLKLILRLFELHLERLPIANDISASLDERTKNFYVNNFEMQFIGSDEKAFIEDVFKHFQQEGLLREIKEASENPIANEVKKLIKENEIDEAFEVLEDYLEDRSEELFNEVMLLSGSYRRVKGKIRKGLIKEEDQKLEMNSLNSALLEIADELKTI